MKDKLVNSHMIDLFVNSGWKDGLVTGNSFYLKKINELHNRLSQLQIVEQFHYISNPNSLIHWALTYVFILPSSFLRLSSSTFWAYSSFFYSKVCTACSYSVGSESCSFSGEVKREYFIFIEYFVKIRNALPFFKNQIFFLHVFNNII